MENSLKTYIRTAFPFGKKKLYYYILGLIAKKGPMVEYQIEKNLTETSRRKINWAIQNFLVPNGFLFVKTKKNKRNIKNAFGEGIEIKPKVYFLTLKGILASLSVTKFEDVYLIQKHKELISQFFETTDISEFAMQVIQYNIELFILKNVAEGSNLIGSNNLEMHFYLMNDNIFSFNKLPQTNDKKLNGDLIEAHTNFRIYSQALNTSLKKTLNEELERRKSKKKQNIFPQRTNDEFIDFIHGWYDGYVRYWYHIITSYQFMKPNELESESSLISQEMMKQRKPYLVIDDTEVNKKAKLILKEYRIPVNARLSKPRFFTDS